MFQANNAAVDFCGPRRSDTRCPLPLNGNASRSRNNSFCPVWLLNQHSLKPWKSFVHPIVFLLVLCVVSSLYVMLLLCIYGVGQAIATDEPIFALKHNNTSDINKQLNIMDPATQWQQKRSQKAYTHTHRPTHQNQTKKATRMIGRRSKIPLESLHANVIHWAWKNSKITIHFFIIKKKEAAKS